MSSTILFLCTGNYYRSRFAEVLFNQRAREAGLAWRATSRGIATELGVNNVGPLSFFARRELDRLGIRSPEMERFPCQVTAADLEQADRVIALDAKEHRPMMQQRYPDWADRIEYWHVADLEWSPPEVALATLTADMATLLERLKSP